MLCQQVRLRPTLVPQLPGGGVSLVIESLYQLFPAMRDEDGQTMAEYAVVLGVITVAVVGALTVLSGAISTVLASVTSAL